ERSLDLSSLSAGPSCKRCRSPTTLVPLSTPVLRSIAPTHADLLPPHKKFRDSYLHEDSSKEHIEIAIEELISQQVAEALANYEVTCSANALEAKSQSQNGNDGENENGNRNHGDGGNKESGNLNENGRGAMPVARVCTYQDFVKCQPL
nr:hypothetical protein [Tanacetum cinerariifolium]